MAGNWAHACALLFLVNLEIINALTFNVDPSKEECLYEDINLGTRVSGSFQVSTGGFLDIGVKVHGPDDRMVYSVERETEGRFSFVAHASGVHRFCFSNAMSTATPKTVSFSLIVGETSANNEVAKSEHIDPLEKSVNALMEGLQGIQAEQEYMRMRERAHRNTSESTNARVLWWSIVEAVALVALSIAQIMFLRSFFETRHRV